MIFFLLDRQLKEAITNISHDLRTPLTAICGYLDLLEQEEKSEVVNRYFEIIKERTTILKQLTEELFRYSYITSVNHEMIYENVQLNRALEESISSYYATLIEQLFDRFYTVEAASKSTGLGLTIAKALTEQMNGKISATYEEGGLSIHLKF